jgi:hypothetical protein
VNVADAASGRGGSPQHEARPEAVARIEMEAVLAGAEGGSLHSVSTPCAVCPIHRA